MDKTERQRLQQLLRCVPDVFEYKSVLYVGANLERMELFTEFRKHGYKIVILEAWKPNVMNLVKKGFDVIDGDVRQIDRHIKTKFDVVLWWHGPEHVNIFEAGYVLGRLEAFAKKIVVAGSPHGKYSQGAVGGNPFERHLCELYVDDYDGIGWEVNAIGEEDVKGSNLIGWKRT